MIREFKRQNIILLLFCLFSLIKLQAKQNTDSIEKYRYIYLEALVQEMKGNTSGAFDLMSYALELNPKAAEVYYKIADYLLLVNEGGKARKFLERASELSPKNLIYLQALAGFYYENNEINKTLFILKKIYNLSTYDRDKLLDIMYALYEANKDYKNMLIVIDEMDKLGGDYKEITLRKMGVYSQMGDIKKEHTALLSLLHRYPENLDYQLMNANWLLRYKRLKEAFNVIQSVLKKYADNIDAKLTLLDYYTEIGNNIKRNGIINQLLSSTEVDEIKKAQLLALKVQDSKKKNYKDSVKVLNLFDKALSTAKDKYDILILKLEYLKKIKANSSEIYKVYDTLIQLYADDISVLTNVLASYIPNLIDNNKLDKALSLSKKGQEIEPTNIAFYFYEGIVYYQQKNNDAALKSFSDFFTHVDDSSDTTVVATVCSFMGEIYIEKKMYTDAFKMYDKAISLSPNDSYTLNNYAYYISLYGDDLEKAAKMSYKTVQAEPTNQSFLDTYAWILFKQCKYKEAKKYIDKLLKANANVESGILEHAGDIYYKAGFNRESLEFWKKSKAKGNQSETLKRKIEQQKFLVE